MSGRAFTAHSPSPFPYHTLSHSEPPPLRMGWQTIPLRLTQVSSRVVFV